MDFFFANVPHHALHAVDKNMLHSTNDYRCHNWYPKIRQHWPSVRLKHLLEFLLRLHCFSVGILEPAWVISFWVHHELSRFEDALADDSATSKEEETQEEPEVVGLGHFESGHLRFVA